MISRLDTHHGPPLLKLAMNSSKVDCDSHASLGCATMPRLEVYQPDSMGSS